jgi:hypothetical protein
MAPLVTLADYQTATGSTANPGAQQIALDDAIAACLTYTDRDFASTPVTDSREYTYRGTGFLEIDDATKVNSVTSDFPLVWWAAHSDGPTGFAVLSWLELPKFDRQALASIGAMGFTSNLDVLLSRSGWVPEWTVTVNADWGIAPVPNDVRRGIIKQAQEYERTGLSNSSGEVSSETVAETSRSYVISAPAQPASTEDAGYSAAATALWWPYKRHTL